MSAVGFIVIACVRTHAHASSLLRCIHSIRQYHTEPIVVLVDPTSILTLIDVEDGVNYIYLEPPVTADMQVFGWYAQNNVFETAIILQDSMYLLNPFDMEEVSKTKDIHYMWHFTNHRLQWAHIIEPNGMTHDELNMYCINTLISHFGFKEYCLSTYMNKHLWSGCFGFACILTHTFASILEEQTHISTLMAHATTNRLRRSMESLFSLACQYAAQREIHTSYDGLYYDGVVHNGFRGYRIAKVSFDRQ